MIGLHFEVWNDSNPMDSVYEYGMLMYSGMSKMRLDRAVLRLELLTIVHDGYVNSICTLKYATLHLALHFERMEIML